VSGRRDAAAATLERLGVAPDAVTEGRCPADALGAVVAGPEGTALVRALGEFPSPAVADLLVALEPVARDRATRREIRRALYRLEQRGVPRPALPAPPPRPRPREPEPEGFVSGFGGDGDRIAWIVRPLPDGGSLVVHAHLNEPHGLVGLSTGEIGRKKLRSIRQQLEADTRLRLAPAPWRAVDALLMEGQARAGAHHPEHDYLRVRPRITADPPAPPAEPVSARLGPLAAEEATVLAADPAPLLTEPELRSWGPPPEALAPFVEEIDRARESPIVLSPAGQQDRMREILARAARTLVPPEVLIRRLDGTAYVLAETGREARAREALAAATLLRARPEAAAEVPLVAALTERALAALLKTEVARHEEERRESLLVTPGEFMRDRASSRRRRTPG